MNKWTGVLLSAVKSFTAAFLSGVVVAVAGYIPGTDLKKFGVVVLLAGIAAGLKAIEKYINWED